MPRLRVAPELGLVAPILMSGAASGACNCFGGGGAGGGALGAGSAGFNGGGGGGEGVELKHILFLFHLLFDPLNDMALTSTIHDLFNRHVRSGVNGRKGFVERIKDGLVAHPIHLKRTEGD